MHKKEVKTRVVISLATGILLSALTAYALATRKYIETFADIAVVIKNVYASGRLIDFGITWFLILGTVWFVFNKLEERSAAKKHDRERVLKKISWLLMILAAIFLTKSIAEAVLKNTDIVKNTWMIAWMVYLYFSTFFATRNEEGEKHDYAGYAITYFITSIFIAPFNSLLADQSMSPEQWAIHGLIAYAGIYLWPKKIEKRREKKLALEQEEKEGAQKKELLKKERDERAFELRKLRYQNKMEKSRMDEKMEVLDKLQTQASSGVSNIQSMHPLLASIAEAIPVQDNPIFPVVVGINIKEEAERIKKDMLDRKKVIQKFTEKYSTTNPGKEAAYLLGVIKDLQNDKSREDRKKWTEYLGANWNEVLFAEKLREFNNRNLEEWIKIFRKSAKRSPAAVIEAVKRRLIFIGKEKKRAYDEYTKNLERIMRLSPELSAEYENTEREIELLNEKIITHNNKVNELNNLYGTLRNSLIAASRSETGDVERKTAIQSKIIPLFRRAMETLDIINNFEKEIAEMNESFKKVIDKLAKTEETMFTLKGLTLLLNKRFNVEFTEAAL